MKRSYYQMYQMMDDARRESVNRTPEDARRRQIRAERKRRARNVYRFQGALLAVILSAATFITVPKVVSGLNNDFYNDSYRAGYTAVSEEVHRTSDNKGFWFDYYDIAGNYQEEMDFDSFVYGTYVKIANSGSGRTMTNMDDLFSQYYRNGYTPYSSFENYLFAHGFTKEKGGKLVVDLDKYESAIKDYLKSLKEVEDIQEEIHEFRSK